MVSTRRSKAAQSLPPMEDQSTVLVPAPISEGVARARAAGRAKATFQKILKLPYISRDRKLAVWLSTCVQNPPVRSDQLAKDLDGSHIFVVKIFEPQKAVSLMEAELGNISSRKGSSNLKIRDHPSRLDAGRHAETLSSRGKRMSQQLGNDSKLDNAVMTAVAPLLE